MDPADFLKLARRLLDSTEQAELRTSVSRSYYAVFHVLLQALSSKGIRFKRTVEDHPLLAHYLAASGDARTQKLGVTLNSLRVERNAADYELHQPTTEVKTRLAYVAAEKAFASIGSIPAADLNRIVAAINSAPPYVARPRI